MTSDDEIDENELYFLNKLRVEEGIEDEVFAFMLASLMEKSEQEIYQIGIDSINRCPDNLKIRIFKRLYQMAMSDNILRVKEVRFILYAIKLVHADINELINSFSEDKLAA